MKSATKMSEKRNYVIYMALSLLFTVIVFFVYSNQITRVETEPETEIKMISDGTKYLVNPDLIKSGGPRMGGIGVDVGIPALAEENIKFVSLEDADKWIEDNELVLVLKYKNETRIYPHQIMVWHEIVNDVIGGDPLLITYCPLCGSGIAYERTIEIEGVRVETRFGVSGKLYNSNLIMYDEKTNTYWQQIGGLAIVGELTGQKLTHIDLDTVVWRDWKNVGLNSSVLSQDTGIRRDYGEDPYGNYYEDSFLIFPVNETDNRVHPKTAVLGIEINGEFSAYREEDIKLQVPIYDVVGGVEIEIVKNLGGDVDIVRLDTNEKVPKERGFWFSWYAFHPQTKLYGVEPK